ncbi:MAG: methionine adenosyltransferase domain-containing protein, partial [Bacteroidales bacterium]|nr:methionine adenosyltransferase domain-containing protein [Bacteroidales bacterium]
KNLVAAGVADEALVQVAYAIGVAEPVGFMVNTNGTAKVGKRNGKPMSDKEISQVVFRLFDLRPYSIINKFGLRNPIFEPTASYGHFGRNHFIGEVEVYFSDKDTVKRVIDGKTRYFKNVEFFTWEKLDAVDKIREAFSMDD